MHELDTIRADEADHIADAGKLILGPPVPAEFEPGSCVQCGNRDTGPLFSICETCFDLAYPKTWTCPTCQSVWGDYIAYCLTCKPC